MALVDVISRHTNQTANKVTLYENTLIVAN